MKRVFLLLLLACCLLTAPSTAAGGSGTATDPYIIQTAAELQSINNNLGAYYRLTADIDLAGITWTPIGTISAGFFGELDGNGHTIKNLILSITKSSGNGLFSTLTSGATIKDLTLQDCMVTTSNAGWNGGLTGSIIMSSSAHETATISNVDCVRCSVLSTNSYVSNLVGLIYTAAVVEIVDCDISASNAESTGSDYVSNLVGGCHGGSSTHIMRCTVTNSHAKAPGYSVSNLVGECTADSSVSIENCDVNNCIAESTSGYSVSNLVGICYSGSSVSVENCDVNNCIAKGTNYVGGLVGLVDVNNINNVGSNFAATNCNINDCTIVATSNYAGGIAGRIVTTCTGIFSGCTVSECTILANTYAAGVCPAYS